MSMGMVKRTGTSLLFCLTENFKPVALQQLFYL